MNTNDERADQTIVIDGNTFVAELMQQLRKLPRKYEDRIIK